MSDTQWLILIALAVYILLAAIAFKWPRTRDNWTKERKETAQLLMSMTIFLMLFFALWWISWKVEWPDAIVIIVWSIFFTFLGLVLVGIFAPQGIKFKFEKKKEAKVPDEDE